MKYYLGVDGGGTKTEFVWTDEGGRVALREVRGSSNPNDIGKDKMIADMVAAISETMPEDADMVAVCMGLSGLGFSGCKEELERAVSNIEKVALLDICSDVQIALDSAYDGDGCIVIVGTGSVGYLRKNGEHILVGGCGYMIDSSLSGYDLGREVINAVCEECDGRGEKTALSSLLFSASGMTAAELVKTVYLRGKAFVASFAPLVFTAYTQGDKIAEEILARRVKEWEKLLLGVHRAYGQERCEITLIGSIGKQIELLLPFLSEETRKQISFRLSEQPAVYGALKRAKRLTE